MMLASEPDGVVQKSLASRQVTTASGSTVWTTPGWRTPRTVVTGTMRSADYPMPSPGYICSVCWYPVDRSKPFILWVRRGHWFGMHDDCIGKPHPTV